MLLAPLGSVRHAVTRRRRVLLLGNRANEGYAEMTVCFYLPDGRVLRTHTSTVQIRTMERAAYLNTDAEKGFKHLVRVGSAAGVQFS